MKSNKYDELLTELRLAGVDNADVVIRGMCIAFGTECVTDDVVEAIRIDYLHKE